MAKFDAVLLGRQQVNSPSCPPLPYCDFAHARLRETSVNKPLALANYFLDNLTSDCGISPVLQ